MLPRSTATWGFFLLLEFVQLQFLASKCFFAFAWKIKEPNTS